MQELLDRTLSWRAQHRAMNNSIEVLACNIRAIAIVDCMLASGQITLDQAKHLMRSVNK